jgi:hypothetical protein
MSSFELTEDEGFFLTTLEQDLTELPFIIGIFCEGQYNSDPNPYILVMENNDTVFDQYKVIKIKLKKDITEKDILTDNIIDSIKLSMIRNFINLNYDLFIDHWNNIQDTADVVDHIKII